MYFKDFEIMLRKRSRSNQKNQLMDQLMFDAVSEPYFHSDVLGQKTKNNPFFNAPCLFVGFNPKNLESDSVRSPTSPLDFKLFANFGNPFRSPRLSNEGHQKRWDCSKVGLSIIDCLENESKHSEKVLRLSNSRNILFGPQMRIKSSNFQNLNDSSEVPKSLPTDVAIFPCTQVKSSNHQKGNSNVLFGIGEAPFEEESGGNFHSFTLDSGRSFSHLANFSILKPDQRCGDFNSENSIRPMPSQSGAIGGSFNLGNSSQKNLSSDPKSTGSGTGLIGNIPPSEIELSEDYTCVRTHGPNPKVTHIFGDCVLECHNNEVATFFTDSKEEIASPQAAELSDIISFYLPIDFLKFCYSCKKKLDGEDIYMYRGEKAFCSWSCRSQEILLDEEMEKTNNSPSENSHELNSCEENFENTLFIDT
ncbi:Hypothetical predicted protein [Olea europaea subsp. europaea]|uniref:FLZ-type domain-containing protein n=2 Tax=Olea europaea subsp. europaea TaxID=158383 RepID=A0A8S0SXE8_OLEEU|nr:Hypothetical predicted protein [Olea europaea subsp. europaea]